MVPGLSSRKATTRVELADGQSFAIAGLLSEEARQSVDKFPLLGDIPILGLLFKSKGFQKNETELVIVVTPRLVRPLDTTRQTLPTDFYVEPNDIEFYLEGLLMGREKRPPVDPVLLDGQFGHAVPGDYYKHKGPYE